MDEGNVVGVVVVGACGEVGMVKERTCRVKLLLLSRLKVCRAT